jgi:hypothetical protein
MCLFLLRAFCENVGVTRAPEQGTKPETVWTLHPTMTRLTATASLLDRLLVRLLASISIVL